jgi:hypothetical protein
MPLTLKTPEERRFRTVIRNGVSKGWGTKDPTTHKEMSQHATVRSRIRGIDTRCGETMPPTTATDASAPPSAHYARSINTARTR